MLVGVCIFGFKDGKLFLLQAEFEKVLLRQKRGVEVQPRAAKVVMGRNMSSTFSPNGWTVGYNKLVFLHMLMKIMLHSLFYLHCLEPSVSLPVQLWSELLHLRDAEEKQFQLPLSSGCNLQSAILHISCEMILN